MISQNINSEINYFPDLGQPNLGQPKLTKTEEHQKVIDIFNRLCKTMETVIPPETDEEKECMFKSLAFIVEATKQLDDKNWSNLLKGLNVKILDTNNNPNETKWMLTKLIDNLYEKSLALHALKAQKDGNAVEKKEFQMSLDLYKMVEEMNEQDHKEGKNISFGGIRDDFIPKWYYERQPESP